MFAQPTITILTVILRKQKVHEEVLARAQLAILVDSNLDLDPSIWNNERPKGHCAGAGHCRIQPATHPLRLGPVIVFDPEVVDALVQWIPGI